MDIDRVHDVIVGVFDRLLTPLSQGIKGEVDLFEVHLTAARQPSARIYRPHPGLARRIPVDSSSRDHPVRRRSKGQMAT
jgi:hypothetical protein